MSTIEEVKAKIKAGEINEAMSMAMAEAMKIEVVTTLVEEEKSPSTVYFRTLIDLLQNEIDNEFGESFSTHQNAVQIQKLHFQEVEIAHERILQHIQSLQKMFVLLQDNLEK